MDVQGREMTHQQIIGLAREVGLSFVPEANSPLVKIVQKAVAMEREACAKACEARYMGDNNREDQEAKRCAAAIRARGEA